MVNTKGVVVMSPVNGITFDTNTQKALTRDTSSILDMFSYLPQSIKDSQTNGGHFDMHENGVRLKFQVGMETWIPP